MLIIGLVVTLIGLSASLGGAAWLYFGIDPNDERFTDDGLLYPGQQRSKVLPEYIQAQQRPTLLVLIGGGLQVVGGVLSLFSTIC